MADHNGAGICVLAGDAALCLSGADQHMESDIPFAGAVFHCTDCYFFAGVSDLYIETQIPQGLAGGKQ